MSESESESSTFSVDFIFGFSFAFFGGDIFCVGVTVSLGNVFGVDSLWGTCVDLFLATLIMPPPTLRTGLAPSSSADRLAGMEGVTG